MYSDELWDALQRIESVRVNQLDYVSLYPGSLTPAVGQTELVGDAAVIHWASPASWRVAAKSCHSIAHLQYWSLPTSHALASVAKHLRALGKRVVLTVHNPSPHECIPGFSLWERRLLEHADAIIVHSDSGKRSLMKRYPRLNADGIQVIPHGIAFRAEIGLSEADFRRAGLPPDRRYVLMFGNLRGYKGLTVLLRAWRELIARETETDLVIAGRLWSGGRGLLSTLVAHLLGTRRVAYELKTLLKDETLSRRVIFKEGFIEDEEIDALCRIADLGVFPYERFSGQSGAATRAAGWGLPILVSDVGGLPDLVPSASCVVQPGDVHQLSERLLSLLADQTELGELRRQHKSHLASAAWEHVAKQHAMLYANLGKAS
jgi:glycosyltransferase involved in cell wall biosynthesis